MRKGICLALLAALIFCVPVSRAEWTDGLQEDDFVEPLPEEPAVLFSEADAEDGETEDGEAEPDASPSPAVPERMIQLKKGSRGEEVRMLQLRLQELGYFTDVVDGDFGPATREAVRAFQRRNDLSVDGIAGKQTQTRLYSEDAIPVPPPADPVDVLAGEWPWLTNLQHPVGEDFLPADLVLLTDLCDSSLVKIKYPETQGVRTAVEALVTMLEAARDDGITKWQVSAGYRSYAQQERLLENSIQSHLKRNQGWTRSRARRAALRTVAEPGASEHHLGLSFDINVPGASAFSATKQCKWLHAHCWEYGFIVRYPEGKQDITGFAPEAWHVRYTGVEHSLLMRDEDLCLEEYLEKYGPAPDPDALSDEFSSEEGSGENVP